MLLQAVWGSDVVLSPGSPAGSLKLCTVSPAACTPKQLFGAFASDTLEWRDGLVTGFLRRAASDDSGGMHVLAVSGPLTEQLVECLSSV